MGRLSWSALGSGMNNTVIALAVDARAISMRGVILRPPAACAKPYCQMERHDLVSPGSGMNNTVYALAVDASGNLYAGGNFTTAGGVTANYIAKWNGTSWSALGSGMNQFCSRPCR